MIKAKRSFLRTQRILATWALLILLFSTNAKAQSGCGSSALVCNNLVRVSLDSTCTALITPDVILKDLNIDTSLYRVEVRDTSGNVIPNLLTYEYQGQRLEVRVYCKSNNLYCWGSIIVEDKIKPTLRVEPIDTTVNCIAMPFELDPIALITHISFDDNCQKPDTFSITDFNETIFPCRDTVKIIRRIFTVFDHAGNRCDTTQTIYLLRAELNEIIYPKDTIIDCLDEADLSPAKLGEPEIGVCDHFEVGMNDIEIPVCGVARKILRQWHITDICTNNDTTVTQVIKIVDENAPKFSFMNFDIPQDKVVTDKIECKADVIGINNPQITDCNIDQTIVTVFYQLADANGNLVGELFAATKNELLSDPFDPTTATIIWDLNDIPVGQDFRVIFVADDQCGNISRDTSDVFMLPDTNPPNAVCEGNTTVVLNTDGVTEVFAETFDDNSFDNCGIVEKQVRRFNSSCPGYSSDLQFGDRIHFCCEDINNNPIKVIFRVIDGSGGFSDCIVNVWVQDKRPISITCQDDIRLNCGTTRDEVIAEALNNPPDVVWVCGQKTLDVDVPDYVESECGEASFVITWRAMDLNGQMDSCTQIVTITNLEDAVVNRPSLDINLTTCGNGTHPDDIPNSRPTFSNVDCEKLNAGWEDIVGSVSGSVCTKIIRKWTIIDWCKFDGGNIGTAIVDSFTQIISITDTTNPEITGCDDIAVQDADQSCSELVSFSINATDDCTPDADLTYTYQIDYDMDGSVEVVGNGSAASHNFAAGIHEVIYSVEDLCGNVAECRFKVTVNTDKPPIPLCVSLTEVIIEDNGQGILEAESLNVKSTTGCTLSEANLTFSFNEEGTQPTMTYDCSDIPNGIFNETSIELWVVDDATGAAAACNVIVSISDRQHNACPDNIASSAISGNISDEDLTPVANVPVGLKNLKNGQVASVMTDEFGNYSFEDVTPSINYEVAPFLNGYPMAGVSTLDLVLIQQHILNIRPLTTPYKLLAADVNNSNTISAVDLAILRQLILGLRSDIPNDSWKFIDRSFVFDMNNDPWTYLDHIMVENAGPSEENNDFIGLKIGDVNGNAFVALAQGTAGPRSTKVIDVASEKIGNAVRYHFSGSQIHEISGFQMAINIPEGMRFSQLGSDLITLEEHHYGIVDGELRISWSDEEVAYQDNDVLFYVEFTSGKGGVGELKLAETFVRAEIYDGNIESSGIILHQLDDGNDAITLLQNIPNPFTDETSISFGIPEGGVVHFRITDVSGNTVYKKSKYYQKGSNTIKINSDDLGSSGVFYYTITTATDKKTMRLILLH